MKQTYCSKHSVSIFDVLIVNGLSKSEAASFYGWLSNAEKECGAKWIVQEFKRRIFDLLNAASGRGTKYRVHGDGTWKGLWRPISRLALRRRFGFVRALRLLRLTGLFVAREPTLEDYMEVDTNISSNPDVFDYYYYRKVVSRDKYARDSARRLRDTDYTCRYPLSAVTVPLSRDFHTAEVFVTPQAHIQALDNCPKLVLRNYTYIQNLVGKTLPPEDHYTGLLSREDVVYCHDVVGSITILTKDRGLKKRAVVNPFRLLQLGTSRLANTLFAYLRTKPSVFIDDQDAGAEWAHKKLSLGIRLSSVDLVSATDNIPLLPQMALALELFPWLGEDIKFFGEVSRCYWWSPYESIDLCYTRGHGMGLNGSFPLFTLWLLYLYKAAGASDDQMAVVGDDLIVEAKFTPRILELLSRFGVPVNEAKSLFDSDIAEFVGRLIDKHGNMGVYKASRFDLNKDPLGLIRQYGKRAFRMTQLKYLSKGRKERLLQYYELCLDKDKTVGGVNPVVKEFLSFFSENWRGYYTLRRQNIPKYAVGGCPEHLLRVLIDSITPSWGQYTYKQALDDKTIEDKTYLGQRVVDLEKLNHACYPQWNVKSWSFPRNAYAEAVNRYYSRILQSPVGTVDGSEDLDLSANSIVSPYIERYVDEAVPDVEQSIKLARERKLYSPEKILADRLRSGKMPISYVEKYVRIYRKALARFAKLFHRSS